MFWRTTGAHPMPFHTTSMTIILMGLGRCILYIILIFLVSPWYYSTSSGSMRFSFFENLNDYYHEFHGIINSFHDQDHDRDHVYGFRTISHSLQGMVRIQLDGTGDFSSKSHYFSQQVRRHDINSEYFLNLCSRYCCCKSTFKA